MEVYYLYASFIFLTSGAVITAFLKNKSVSGFFASIFTVFSSLCLVLLSIEVLLSKKKTVVEIFNLKPLINSSLYLAVDSLSALFILIIALISSSTIIFSKAYISVYDKLSPRGFYPSMLLLFIASLGVVCTADLLFFILSWELMTLSSWFLVVYKNDNKSALKAGIQYFIATHVATAFLILASVLIYSYSKSFSFLEIKEIFISLMVNRPIFSHFIIFCVFIAFITKAGVLPFGFWLPNTYPQPPSSASSFFGGVMSKLGVYALLRFFLSVFPIYENTEIWGLITAFAGVFSIFVGTIAALTQDEAKRLMSFHAIGQVGYMLLGIGVGLYFIKINPFLSVVGFIGGIFHILNNSIYKSLLFLNGGAIFYKTATTDLNNVSGLIKVMPLTAITALVGSLSIAGVPPFNGFVSKLLIFESSIWAGIERDVLFLIKFIFIVFGILSVFISAITLASFLKFINSAFMGKLKGVDEKKGKIPLLMNIPQLFLAFLCIILGLFPLLPLEFIYQAIVLSLNMSLPNFHEIFNSNIAGFSVNLCKDCEAGAWFPIFVMLPLAVLSLLIFSFESYAKTKKRDVETWYGGKEHDPEEVTYSGHSFYQPFKSLVSFRIGSIYFKGFYPEKIPSIKFNFTGGFLKVFNVDEWIFYPIASKFRDSINFIEKSYNSLIKKYITFFIFGIMLILFLFFYLYEVKL